MQFWQNIVVIACQHFAILHVLLKVKINVYGIICDKCVYYNWCLYKCVPYLFIYKITNRFGSKGVKVNVTVGLVFSPTGQKPHQARSASSLILNISFCCCLKTACHIPLYRLKWPVTAIHSIENLIRVQLMKCIFSNAYAIHQQCLSYFEDKTEKKKTTFKQFL